MFVQLVEYFKYAHFMRVKAENHLHKLISRVHLAGVHNQAIFYDLEFYGRCEAFLY